MPPAAGIGGIDHDRARRAVLLGTQAPPHSLGPPVPPGAAPPLLLEGILFLTRALSLLGLTCDDGPIGTGEWGLGHVGGDEVELLPCFACVGEPLAVTVLPESVDHGIELNAEVLAGPDHPSADGPSLHAPDLQGAPVLLPEESGPVGAERSLTFALRPIETAPDPARFVLVHQQLGHVRHERALSGRK